MTITTADLLFTPVPPRISRLRELAFNIWWSWHPEAQELFRQIDPELWEQDYHNPVDFLRDVRERRLVAAAEDAAYLQHYDQVLISFDRYVGCAGYLVRAHLPRVENRHDRLFLGRVWPARIAADLFGWPGRAGRRSR